MKQLSPSNNQLKGLMVVLLLVGLLIGYSLEQKLRLYRNESAEQQKQHPQEHELRDQQVDHHQHQQEQQQQQQQQTTLSSSMLKKFIRINNVRAYHLDLHSYRDEVKFDGDPVYVNSLDDTHKANCVKHLSIYHQLIKQYHQYDPIGQLNSLAALELADAFGRPEAGVLNGNQFWLGSYDGCLAYKHSIVDTFSNDTTTTTTTTSRKLELKAQYCLGVAQFQSWNPSETKSSLKIGLCLPETCTNSMLNENPELLAEIRTMMMYHIHPQGPFSKLQLRSVYCLPHETSQLRQLTLSAKLLISLIGFLVSLSIFATILDNDKTHRSIDRESMLPATKTNWKQVLIESFSITRNVKAFFTLRRSPKTKSNDNTNIDPGSGCDSDTSDKAENQQSSTEKSNNKLNNSNSSQQQVEQQLIAGVDYTPFDQTVFFESMAGIKCIGLFWIVAAHTFLVSPILATGLADLDKATKTYLADIYLGAHLMVDTFFVLMGIIASYLLFNSGIEKFKTRHWVVMTIHRYWRLTPIYLVCYWYTKSLGAVANSGPLWDFATSEVSPRVNCARESWFAALLHLSDFKSPKDHCVPFAWFIANGIKFWIVTPFFLLPIVQNIKRGYYFMGASIIANVALVYWLASRAEVDVQAVIEFRPESADNMLNNMGQIYTRPYSRIGAYLIGLLAGHIFFLERSGSLRVKLSRESARIGWILFLTVSLGLLFLLKIVRHLQLDETLMRDTFSTGSAVIRPLWALCSCWLVFALSHGETPWLAKFLSARFWLICVKLSFCAYLCQGEIIANLYLAASTVSPTTQYLDLISRPLFVIVLTLLLSFLMVIFIEYPLNGIEKLILPSKSKSKSKHKTIEDPQHEQILQEQKVK